MSRVRQRHNPGGVPGLLMLPPQQPRCRRWRHSCRTNGRGSSLHARQFVDLVLVRSHGRRSDSGARKPLVLPKAGALFLGAPLRFFCLSLLVTPLLPGDFWRPFGRGLRGQARIGIASGCVRMNLINKLIPIEICGSRALGQQHQEQQPEEGDSPFGNSRFDRRTRRPARSRQ